MHDRGVKMVAISAIKYEMPDIRRRMTQPAVIELAESRKRLRIHPPVVGEDMQLIAGRDRLAADLLNKTKRIEVRIVEATPEERLDLEIDENLHRRPVDRDALIARRVNRVTAELVSPQEDTEPTPQLPDNLSTNSPKRKPGRPPTVGPARAKVAAELGTTPEAVRKAEARAAAALEPAPEPLTGPALALAEVQEAIDGADKAMRACQGALSRLDGLHFEPALRQRLLLAAHALAVDIRTARPEAVCCSCEGTGAFCEACDSIGLQTATQVAGSVEAARQVRMFADRGKKSSAGSRPGVHSPADATTSGEPAPADQSGGDEGADAVPAGAGLMGGSTSTTAPAPGESPKVLLKAPFQLSPKQRKPALQILDEKGKPIDTSAPVNDDDLPF
jgi:ParB-like chromosome segregation protein Spo0J